MQGEAINSRPAVSRRVEGGRDSAAYAEKKARLLELLALFVKHGHVSFEDLSKSLGWPPAAEPPAEPAALRQRITDLEKELRAANLSRELLEDEVGGLESALRQERELVKEEMGRMAHLEGQLRDARRTAVKLIGASRTSLTTLRKVRSDPLTGSFAREALDPLLHDLREVATTVQELHTLAVIRVATAPGKGPSG